jgi:hypothetical protein
MSNNTIHTYGDDNISLQNVQARDINIFKNSDSPEIKAKKDEIAEDLAQLLKDLGTIQDSTESKEPEDLDDSMFEDVKWSELLDAIRMGYCVLFVGQGLATGEDGESIHESFYKEIASEKIRYDENEGFFLPGSRKQLKMKSINFYEGAFIERNKKGYELLEQLSQIPMSLTISICPDDTLRRINEKYNKKNEFLFYDGTKKVIGEPTLENPVIYSLLGSPAKNGEYIFTHEDFYQYMNAKQEVKIPTAIEAKVREAFHYVFLGVDFNKWFNRILLFTFNLDNDTESFALNSKSISDLNEQFIKRQFDVSVISNHFDEFIKVLLMKCRQEGLFETLIDSFIRNTIEDIKKLQDRAIDSDSASYLTVLKDEIGPIKSLIQNFQ